MQLDLFSEDLKFPQKILPNDSEVLYYGKILTQASADIIYHRLFESIGWQRDQVEIFGKRIVTRRKVAWYGDQPYRYTYSKTTKHALSWTPELLSLKHLTEAKVGVGFNSCLLNLYHNGSEGMSWHCDDEKDLQKHAAIASLSLGAERKFSFKHKQSKEKVSLLLQHGSLLVMQGKTQIHWLHQLPPSRKVTSPRINLTFRTICD